MLGWVTSVAEVNGVRISYLRTGGDMPPAVLLHGLMGSGASWTPVARLLAAELDVIMPDARGHGRSSTPASGYRYPDLADDVAALTHELSLSGPVLIGHSMGGMTATLVASRLGHLLRALVLVDPTFLSRERQREVYESDVAAQHGHALRLGRSALVEAALSRHPHRSRELVELQVEARLSTSEAALDILRPPTPPYRGLVAALEVPTLLVIGDEPVVTLDLATELCELNPRLRVEQIHDAGHGLPFDQPERLAETVLAFVRGLPGLASHPPRRR
jgi:pimeloyl-ACP methyl ester carboxylesterase